MPFHLKPCPLCFEKAVFEANPPAFADVDQYKKWPFDNSFRITCSSCGLTLQSSDPVELVGRWQLREAPPAQAEESPAWLMPGCVELAKVPEEPIAGIGVEWHACSSNIQLDATLPSKQQNIIFSIQEPLEMLEGAIGKLAWSDLVNAADIFGYPVVVNNEAVAAADGTTDAAAEPAQAFAGQANVKKLPAKLARGTRIPPDWKLSQENHEIAKELGVLYPKTLAESFYDYWTAVPGVRGYKLDWDATWRNWCRRSVEFYENRNAGRRA
jgi:hypothetical protein